MSELERLKAENQRLREYANFKRDIRSWRTWAATELDSRHRGVVALLCHEFNAADSVSDCFVGGPPLEGDGIERNALTLIG